MRGISVCLAALLTSATLSAQVKLGESPDIPAAYPQAISAGVKLGESPAVLFASPMSSGCPIGIAAERSLSVIVKIRSAGAAPQTQGLQLRFQHLLAPGIEGVTGVVHGLSGKSRMMPAGSDSSSDVAETFHLNRPEQAASLSAAYLQPKTVRMTQWIELTSVDYTDGSSWHSSQAARCRVTPSNLVLVAGR